MANGHELLTGLIQKIDFNKGRRCFIIRVPPCSRGSENRGVWFEVEESSVSKLMYKNEFKTTRRVGLDF